MPGGMDFVLLASLVAYSGCGGITNVTLSNWARDRGYGMGERVGYIPAAVGGQRVHLAHTGFIFTPDAANMTRWHGWWRVVRADQWGIFFMGGMLGMALPALLYVTFLPRGTRYSRARHRRGARVEHRRTGRRGDGDGDRAARRLAALQDPARQPRRHGARAHGHAVDGQLAHARVARRRRPARLLHRAGCRRGLGPDRAQARPTDHAAADRRQRRGDRLHHHVPACAVHQHETPAAGAPPADVAPGRCWCSCRSSTGSSRICRSRRCSSHRSFTTKITKRTKGTKNTKD